MSRQCLSETANGCDRYLHHHPPHNHQQHHHYGLEGDVGSSGFLLCGYHKKLKTMKKKYFVLYRDSAENVARLEYYDNDKKFKSGFNAKRIIKLKNCFNISRRMDTKYDFVIALATKEGGFGIVIESEVEMNKWLNNLLSLQRKYCGEFDLPLFDHVWQVVIQRKGLAEQKGLIGNYHVCLTNKSITFLKISSGRSTMASSNSQRLQRVDVLLTTVRRCGDSQCYFYMEIGRQSTIGPGELWMETEDSLIAKNMHGMILSKMVSINEAPQVEPMRKRSSSATEATKPLNDMQRKIVQTLSTNLIRKRCDSLPSRNCLANNDTNNTATSTATTTTTTTSTSSKSTASTGIVSSSVSCQQQQRSHAVSQQLNNSSSTMINSESEESSASYEESDDAVSYSLYRLSTQNTTDGIIPEEGSDEPCNVETLALADTGDDQNADNLKYCLTSVAQPSNLKTSNLSGKYLHTNSGKYITEKHPKDFAQDHGISTATNTIASNEADLCSLRPVRAYSVGNRIQHNNLQVIKEKCNENCDNFVGRVRAFSVGSKTKAAKFETCSRSSPRAMLHNYHMNNMNNTNNGINFCINNNNNNNMDNDNGLYCIMDGNAKKSTSVPLLSSKRYHASTEQMSDLMEIDFSKSSRKYTNSHLTMHKESETPPTGATTRVLSSSTTATMAMHCLTNPPNTMLHKSFESLDMVDMPAPPHSPPQTMTAAIAAIDNGYLEMRPISASTAATPFELQAKIESSSRDFMSLPVIKYRLSNENGATATTKLLSPLPAVNAHRSKEDLSLKYLNHDCGGNDREALSLVNCKRNGFSFADSNDVDKLVEIMELMGESHNDNDHEVDKDSSDNLNCNRTSLLATPNATDADNNKVPLSHAPSCAESRDDHGHKEEEQSATCLADISSSSEIKVNNNDCLQAIVTKESKPPPQQQNLSYLKLQYTKSCSNEHLLAQNNASSSPTRNTNLSASLANRKVEGSSPIIDKVSLNNVNNLNNTLYYASLDLPVCSKEYNAKSIHPTNLNTENFYDKTLVNNLKNVYAKIDFDHPEALTFTRQNS